MFFFYPFWIFENSFLVVLIIKRNSWPNFILILLLFILIMPPYPNSYPHHHHYPPSLSNMSGICRFHFSFFFCVSILVGSVSHQPRVVGRLKRRTNPKFYSDHVIFKPGLPIFWLAAGVAGIKKKRCLI